MGFSLLELLVVISILALATGVMVANYKQGTPSAELNGAIRELVAEMRELRVKSISESLIFRLHPADDGPGYRVIPGDQVTRLPEGFSIMIASATEHGNSRPDEIVFFPDGSSNGGICDISSPAGSAAIHVNWLTGEVSLGDEPQ